MNHAERKTARGQRRADIHTRARILAARQADETGANHWSLYLAISLIGALWLAGCAWLFQEQRRFADHLGFATPEIFPIVVDGGAFVAALLAYAISMSGRTAGGSRLFSATINMLSAAANGVGAWHRSHDTTTVVVAAMVPLVLMWAFHLILGEFRLRVRIRNGMPADKAPPALRLSRVLFAGRWALTEWRAAGLAITDPLPPLPASTDGVPLNGFTGTPVPVPPNPGTAPVHPPVPEGAVPAPRTAPGGTAPVRDIAPARSARAGAFELLDGIPDSDPRNTVELAAYIAPQFGINENTARKYVSEHRQQRGAKPA